MEAIFTFAATRGAITGERILLESGVKVKVMALPSSLGAGCGLCLRVDAGIYEEALRLLAASDIHPQGVYYKHAAGGKISYEPVKIEE